MNPSENELHLRKLDRRDKAMRTFEVIILAAVVAITMFALLSIRGVAEENSKNIAEHRTQIEVAQASTSKELIERANINRAKLDIGLCIFSVSPIRRTPDYVKSCYDEIEKESGIKVERFGDGVQ